MSGLEWTFAIVSLVAGLIIGIAINVTTVRRLRLRNRELRAEKHVKSAGNPDVENMSNHGLSQSAHQGTSLSSPRSRDVRSAPQSGQYLNRMA